MTRMLALYTGAFLDIPLEAVCAKASEWGYAGLEIACSGEHFSVPRAVSESGYCQSILEMLEQHELQLVALNHRTVGQAITDTLDRRHQEALPEWIWGDGHPEAIAARAAQELIDTAQAAQQLGVNLITGGSGSPFTAIYFGGLPASPAIMDAGWQLFLNRWKPILDHYEKSGIRYACELSPAQIAFDIYSSTLALEALNHHPAWSFALNPAHLHWQGVSPVEYLREHAASVSLVYVQDVAISLNGRSGLLGSLLPMGNPKRGWNLRSPGLGEVNWTALLRGLHQHHFRGPLSVHFNDQDVDRDYGASEAVSLIRKLDFTPATREIGLFV